MKRFLVFAFKAHYPMGGWYDLWGTFDSVPEAEEALRAEEPDNWWGASYHIVDGTTGACVRSGKMHDLAGKALEPSR